MARIILCTVKFQLTHPSRGATLVRVNNRKSNFISTHTPLAGCDKFHVVPLCLSLLFQLTHPSRGATALSSVNISNPSNFNSHTPRGVRLSNQRVANSRQEFQLTHPSRGATGNHDSFKCPLSISTHTPLAGCDYPVVGISLRYCISTHTPLAGCDALPDDDFRYGLRFQLTHPSRGATIFPHGTIIPTVFQLTHPSRGATERTV